MNTLICYFGDEGPSVNFNRKQEKLTKNQAEILRYILLKGNEKRPVTIMDIMDILELRNPESELKIIH